MSRRRSNMLEAFQATDSSSEQATKSSPADLFSGGPALGEGGVGRRAPVIIMFLGTLALGFLLGRLSAPGATVLAGEEVDTAEGGRALSWLEERGAGAGPEVRDAGARDAGARAAEQAALMGAMESAETSGVTSPAPAATTGADLPASPGNAGLWDMANRVTLRVIYYAEDEEQRAWETHDYLAQRGLPVGSPVRTGRIIVLLVGAAPGADGLNELKTSMRALEGPNRENGAFKGAYVVNIDSYLDR
ncbi:MAG: hypothetical protein QF411_08195 [Planctomycetota bacterium]|nr:hypothetical protein [Planctomycetota bacterium]